MVLRPTEEYGTMAIGEAARHELYDQLVGLLGPGPTETLMGHLPPVGWADVATKQDLRILELSVQRDLAALRGDMSELRAEMAERFRQQTLALVGTMVTLSAITGTAAALL